MSTVATAIAQWRQGLINCMTNKQDPFNAITCCFCMLACLPPEFRPKKDELKKYEPRRKEYLEDPEQTQFDEEAWKYIRTLSVYAEEANAKYVANKMSEVTT